MGHSTADALAVGCLLLYITVAAAFGILQVAAGRHLVGGAMVAMAVVWIAIYIAYTRLDNDTRGWPHRA